MDATPRSAATRPGNSVSWSKGSAGTSLRWKWRRRWRPRPPSRHFRSASPAQAQADCGWSCPATWSSAAARPSLTARLDRAAGVTRFELLPTVGDAALVLSLNSHAQRREEAVLARSVLIDEVAAGCEKLHVAVSLSILYRAVDRFRFVVPDGFEITNIPSPLLARWDIQVEGGRKIANVRLREQTNDPVIVRVEAIRAGSPTDAWKLPQFEPLDVVGHAAVVGVLLEQPLKIESLQAERLIPIDASVLAQAMPEAGPGAARGPACAGGRLLRPAGTLRPVGPVRHAGGGNGRRQQRPADCRGRRA